MPRDEQGNATPNEAERWLLGLRHSVGCEPEEVREALRRRAQRLSTYGAALFGPGNEAIVGRVVLYCWQDAKDGTTYPLDAAIDDLRDL